MVAGNATVAGAGMDGFPSGDAGHGGVWPGSLRTGPLLSGSVSVGVGLYKLGKAHGPPRSPTPENMFRNANTPSKITRRESRGAWKPFICTRALPPAGAQEAGVTGIGDKRRKWAVSLSRRGR